MTTYVPYDPGEGASVASPTPQYVPYEGPVTTAVTKVQADTQPLSMADQLKRQLGLFARAGITGIAGTGAALADFGKGAVEMVKQGDINAKFPKAELPSNRFQQFLTQLGLPTPQGTAENIAGFGAQALAGAMDPGLAAANALTPKPPAGFVSPENAQQAVTKELHNAGYKLPPTEMGGGTATRSLEGFGGSARTAHLAEFENQPTTQALAEKALSLPKGTPLTEATLKNQADQLIKEGYDPIRAIPRVTVGSSYRNALLDIKSELGGSNSFPLAQRNEVNKLVNKYLYSGELDRMGNPRYIQEYTGADALKEVKLLRSEATAQFKPGGDPLLGEAMRRITTALEDNIETSLRGTGSKLIEAFRNTRTELAKNFAVERMLNDPNTGVVSTVKAAQELARGTPLTGELMTIAKAGNPMYARATGVPVGGKPPAINFGDSVLYGAGAGATLAGGGPFAHMLAVYPMLRAGARTAVLSKPMQAMMAARLNPQPSMFGDAAQRVTAASMLPLFSQGEQ